MQRKRENIYKIARKYAGLTREKAAEQICCSVRSLADYETGVTVPKDDIVCAMVQAYGTEWLAYQHLKQNSEIGRRYLPEINISDLAKSVLRLQKEVRDLDYVNDDMIDIACDGEIHHTEKDRWASVTKEIDEMAGAALAVLFSVQKEKALARAI
jgi:transcriptional regulator with XRE-family HTH domain